MVRAGLSDHIPLAGNIDEVLGRDSYHRVGVNDPPLTIYLHRGGSDATFFDLLGRPPGNALDCIGVEVYSRFPKNCFWSARTAISQLLDSMMGTEWLPLTIRRLDLFLEDEVDPLCHQLVIPFMRGVRWGPLGGIHQKQFLAPYASIIREAITTTSPYYRFLCAHRLYEGINPLRRQLRDLGKQHQVEVSRWSPSCSVSEPGAIRTACRRRSRLRRC
jgi:hypothetical protein